MRLEEIEQKKNEEQEKADTFRKEAADHKQRIHRLEQLASELQESISDVDSEGARDAIRQAEESTRESERQLEELRQDKERLLQENAELCERSMQSIEKRQKALERMESMCMLNDSARSPEIGAMVNNMGKAIENDLQLLDDVLRELHTAGQCLDEIDV